MNRVDADQQEIRAELARRGIDWRTRKKFTDQPDDIDKEEIKRELARRGIDWRTGKPLENKQDETPSWIDRQLSGAKAAFLGAGQAAGNMGAAINPANIVSRHLTGSDVGGALGAGGGINPLNMINRQFTGENALPAVDVLSAAPEGHGFSKGLGQFMAEMAVPLPSGKINLLNQTLRGALPYAGKVAESGLEGALKSQLGATGYVLGDESIPSDEKMGVAQRSAMYGGGFGAAAGALAKSPALAKSVDTNKMQQIMDSLPDESLGSVPLSVLSGSKGVAKFEEKLSKLPYGKQREIYQNFMNSEVAAVNRFYNDLSKGVEKNRLDDELLNILRNNKDKLEKQKDVLYGNVTKMADDAGITLSSKESEMIKVAKDSIQKLKNVGTHNPLEKTELYRIMKKMQDIDDIPMQQSKLLVAKSLTDFQNHFIPGAARKFNLSDLQSDRISLNKIQRDARIAGDKHLESYASKMKNAVTQDIENAMKKSGNKNLWNEYLKANNFFKTQLAPYRDKANTGLRRAIETDRPVPNLSNMVLGAKYPKTILDHLGQDGRDILTASALKNMITKGTLSAGYEVDPTQLIKAFGREGKNIGKYKDQLLTPQMQQELEKITNLNKQLEPIKAKMSDPQTGRKVLDEAYAYTPIYGALAGYHHGGLPGAAVGGLTPIIAGKALPKAMMSNTTKNMLGKGYVFDQIPQRPLKSNAILQQLLAQSPEE